MFGITQATDTLLDSPCLSCPGLCCSQNLINLCGYDVWVIATGLSIEPTSFLAFARMDADSPYQFRLDSSEETYFLAVNMREQPDGSRRCVFLMELPNGHTRCGIYGLRPVACRAYPLALTENGMVVKPWAMCPAPYTAPRDADLRFWEQELERHDMEFSIYALAVETWNRKAVERPETGGLDFRPFLEFLMDVYGRLDPARREVAEESWPLIWSRWRQFTARGLNPLSVQTDDSASDRDWTHWLQTTREAVAHSARGIGADRFRLSNRCKETLV